MNFPTTAQIDEYYDALVEEEIEAAAEEAYAESCAEMDAENAWLRHAESQGMDHHEELREASGVQMQLAVGIRSKVEHGWSRHRVNANVHVKYGPDHIYTRIAEVWGGKSGQPNPYAAMFGYTASKVATACEKAHEEGICIQTYADPAAAALTLKALGHLTGGYTR